MDVERRDAGGGDPGSCGAVEGAARRAPALGESPGAMPTLRERGRRACSRLPGIMRPRGPASPPRTARGALAAACLRRAGAAALALVLLCVAAEPTTASANSAGPPDADTITTPLYPGWNLVGWLGPETPSSELFEAIPSLVQISAWDARAARYRVASPRSPRQLPTLVRGMGLWLLVGGDERIDWIRPADPGGLVLRLPAGRNLVTVANPGEVNRLEPSVSVIWRWDAARQRYSPHRSAPDALRRGDALLLRLSAPVAWWQPGTREPPFTFVGEVDPEVREAIVAWHGAAQRIVAERFGVPDSRTHWYIAGDRQSFQTASTALFGVETGGCGQRRDVGRGGVELLELRCAYPLPAPWVAGAFADAMAYEGAGDGGGYPDPYWLLRGQERYLEVAYLDDIGWENPLFDPRTTHRAGIHGTSTPLRSLETVSGASEVPSPVSEGLSFLAVDWLAREAGDLALLEYFRLYWSTDDWRAAFAEAFGMTVEDFYASFEAYRATIQLDPSPPPHLADDAVGVVLAFRGGVPEDYAAEIRRDFDRFRAFAEERLGATRQDLTVYVLIGTPEVQAEFPRWSRILWAGDAECPNAWDEVSFFGIDRCTPSVDGFYLDGAILRGRGPWWLRSGVEAYATIAYRASEGVIDPGIYRDLQIGLSHRVAGSLRDIEHPAGGVDQRAVATLGFLAADWLAGHAGEAALMAFYQQHLEPPAYVAGRPDAEAWRGAFERAFGLTVEDFYERFEAYRATSTEP